MTTKRLIARAKEGFTHFIDCAEWLCLAYQQKDENLKLKPHKEQVKRKFYQLLVKSGNFETEAGYELPIVKIGERASDKLLRVVKKYGYDSCISFFKEICADFDIRLIEFIA